MSDNFFSGIDITNIPLTTLDHIQVHHWGELQVQELEFLRAENEYLKGLIALLIENKNTERS